MARESIASCGAHAWRIHTGNGELARYETDPVREERLSEHLDADDGRGGRCGNVNGD